MKIFDLHCDTLYKFYKDENYSIFQNNGHITEEGLLKGDYLAQCFAVFLPNAIKDEAAYDFFNKQCSTFENTISSCHLLKKANSINDIDGNSKNKKVSAILTVENAEFLNNKIERVVKLSECGVKILGLVHESENCLGFPHSSKTQNNNIPLKKFGKEVVDALNATNIILDVSHLNFGGFHDIAKLSKKPFIATHTACRSLYDHSRNLFDEQIKQVARSGGIVGIAFYSVFLNGSKKTEISDILRHLEYLINVGGEEVAAIGSDFDGIDCELFIKNCAGIQILAEAIIKKFGFSVAEKICYKNALRIF